MRKTSAVLKIEAEDEKLDIGLDAKYLTEITADLSDILAATYRLTIKSHLYHWNVVGPLFKPLQATEGYNRQGNSFVWDSFEVLPGEPGEIAVGRVAIVCRCEEATATACVYATVSDATGEIESSELKLAFRL